MQYVYIREQQEGEAERKNQQLLIYRQLQGIGEEETFVDDGSRESWYSLFDSLAEGDYLLIRSVEDIADSREELLGILQILQEKGVELYAVNEPFLCGDNYFDTFRRVLELINFFQVKRRTTAYRYAVDQGLVGRPPKKEVALALTMHASGNYTVQDIQESTGISKSTLYRALKRERGEE